MSLFSFLFLFFFFFFARSIFPISCIVINRARLIFSHSLTFSSTLFLTRSCSLCLYVYIRISDCVSSSQFLFVVLIFFPALYIDDFPSFMIHFTVFIRHSFIPLIHWFHSCVHFDMIYMFSQILKWGVVNGDDDDDDDDGGAGGMGEKHYQNTIYMSW